MTARSSRRRRRGISGLALAGVALFASALFSSAAAASSPFVFSTGNPDGRMAMASRTSTGSSIEIEAGDDFVVLGPTALTNASFTGLIPMGASLSSIQRVRIGVYRVFPLDSDVTRTSGSPTFSTAQVPTRVNSPSDVDFARADSADGKLSFTPAVVQPTFTSLNSVLIGINPKPNQTTAGEGPVTGQMVSFNVAFNPPLNLPADHYFLVPQVRLASGDFYWLSAPKPIVAPGTPFPMGFTDLQTWIRNANLDPDWLRVGTDIVGGATPPTFNGAFSLTGSSCTSTISVSPTTLPDATAGTPYSATFSAAGGDAPYTFTETEALPGGVSLAANGVLSGTPGGAGSFPIAVTAKGADGCSGTANVTLTVLPRTPPPPGPPDTQISKAKIKSKKRRATFRFKAVGTATGFQCELKRKHGRKKPKFKPCSSPKTFKHLKAGKYTFEVRALSSAGADPSPAKRKFRIKRATTRGPR